MKLPKPARFALPSRQFSGLLISLAALVFMGGSARLDIPALALLNPFMIVCCAAALLTLRRENLKDVGLILSAFCFVFLLVAAYIMPLMGQFIQPSLISSSLGGIYDAADMAGSPHSLAAAPNTALQSLFFLFAPFAVFLFAISLDRDDLRRTMLLVIAIGTVSGVLGVLQVAGGANGSLYFYEVTNNGSAVGLFANRNHAAVFLACLFPLLAIFMARPRTADRSGRNTTQLLAIALSILLVPLILVTGSRSGILAAMIGIVGGSQIYMTYVPAHPAAKTKLPTVSFFVIVVFLCLVLATIYFSRAEAIDRLFAEPNAANDRISFWASSLQMFWQYFPLGFGPGGFVTAYQINEPSNLLNAAYLNRLHNDWLEIVLTFGLPGIFLMLVGGVYYVCRTFALWRRMDGARSAVAMGRMASVIIAILAVASASDYPLRTPAMAGFAALALVWFSHARREQNRR